MSARIAAFVLWAAVAAGLMYWMLRVGVVAPPLPPTAQPVSTAAVLRGDVSRLFADPVVAQGANEPTEPALASRFKLIGVMAPRPGQQSGGQGIALIEVDGKPSRPYRVGRPLDDKLVLQTVAARSITIGPRDGAPAVKLDLPPLPAPATGSLPAVPADGLVSTTRTLMAPMPRMPPPPPEAEPPMPPDAPPMDMPPGSEQMLPEQQVEGEGMPVPEEPPPGIDPSNRR